MTSVERVVESFRRTTRGAGLPEQTRRELREALQATDLLDGIGPVTVQELDDDEALLLDADGREIDTWRQDYPYDERMSREEYETVKRGLQIELLKMQSWVKDTGQRVAVLFEGRDAAGKGGTIKRFTENLNPRGTQVVALEKPTKREQTQWYFQRYISRLPAAGEIVLFDRSWYNRAVVEPVMGFCTPEQHEEFMVQVPGLEKALVDDGLHLVKLWFSVSRAEQRTRFLTRVIDPLRQWKLSPVDLAALQHWDDFTRAKEAMFARTDTPAAPWTVVRSNDKKRGRIAALRWVLSGLDYPTKDPDVVGTPDPLVVGPPAEVYEASERFA
jgi:polyphosphate kinase 2